MSREMACLTLTEWSHPRGLAGITTQPRVQPVSDLSLKPKWPDALISHPLNYLEIRAGAAVGFYLW